MTRQMAPDPHFDESHRDLAGQFREFGERHLMALARQEKAPAERAREVGALLGRAGLLAPVVPRPFGTMDARSALVGREVLASFSLFAEMILAAQGLASHLIDAAGAELQARHAAWLVDVGSEDASRASAAARITAVEAAERAVDRALRVHGAQGLVRGSTVERLFRESRALRLREGTNEMARLELADAILKESR